MAPVFALLYEKDTSLITLFIGKLRQCRFVDGRAWGRLLFDLMTGILMFALLTAAGGSQAAPGSAAAAGTASFPRLIGMNIGTKNYDHATYQKELARLNVIILGFHKGWNPRSYCANSTAAMRKAVQAIKSHNPNVLVGQYTILSETFDNPNDPATLDLRDKLYASHWWLLNAAGRKVQWTSQYSTWEINFTDWTRPDA